MNTLIHIWNKFVESNTFNFVVMIVVLGYIVNKFRLSNAFENVKNSVINKIETAQKAAEDAKIEFNNAQKAVSNVETEIKLKYEEAQKHAENLVDNINQEVKNKLAKLDDNISKIIDNEEKTISSTLTSKTAKISIDIARNHIKKLLQEKPELHEKYINQSIEEIG